MENNFNQIDWGTNFHQKNTTPDPDVNSVAIESQDTEIKEESEEHQRLQFKSIVSRVCKDLLGAEVTNIEFTAGEYRSSFRLKLTGGHSVIATRRSNQGRALLEERVLTLLGKHNAPVPKVLGFNRLLLLQEDMGGQRLSQALQGCSGQEYALLMSQAIQSLIKIHKASEIEGLDDLVLILGGDRNWLSSLIDRPAVLGSYLNIPCPIPPIEELFDVLTVMAPRFIKWDARPGNAIVGDDGKISWIDWEHCGARNRIDDLVWLLCDETTPDYPEMEEQLIKKYLPYFSDGYDPEIANAYLRAFGILHMCVRLGMILTEKGNDSWWDPSFCINYDRAGVTLEYAQTLCRRAARWAEQEPLTEVLSPWFNDVEARLGEL